MNQNTVIKKKRQAQIIKFPRRKVEGLKPKHTLPLVGYAWRGVCKHPLAYFFFSMAILRIWIAYQENGF